MSGVQAATSPARAIQLSSILRAQYSTSKVSLPVDGGVYARFRHVQGVPSSGTQGGFTLNKLQMIDMMVERLIRLQGEGFTPPTGADDSSTFARLAEELHNALQESGEIRSTYSAGIAQSGLLLDFYM